MEGRKVSCIPRGDGNDDDEYTNVKERCTRRGLSLDWGCSANEVPERHNLTFLFFRESDGGEV
jgi:hypothetical protein